VPKTYVGKRYPLQQIVWETWIATCKRLKLDSYLSFCTKKYSNYIKGLHVRPETLKLLQENTLKI
jgi:hypothetical protein